LYYRV